MTNFIKCPSCGFCIGLYLQFYDISKTALLKDHLLNNKNLSSYDPEKLALKPNNIPTMEIIFDAMGIKNRCCRMRIFCKTDFDLAYK